MRPESTVGVFKMLLFLIELFIVDFYFSVLPLLEAKLAFDLPIIKVDFLLVFLLSKLVFDFLLTRLDFDFKVLRLTFDLLLAFFFKVDFLSGVFLIFVCESCLLLIFNSLFSFHLTLPFLEGVLCPYLEGVLYSDLQLLALFLPLLLPNLWVDGALWM